MNKLLLIGTLCLAMVILSSHAYAQFPWSGTCFVEHFTANPDTSPTDLVIFATVNGETFTLCAQASGFEINDVLLAAQRDAVPVNCAGNFTPVSPGQCNQGLNVFITQAGF